MSEKPEFNYTVGDLIEILKKFPTELPVLVSGYETGYENIYEPHITELTHKPENMYWDGEFQQLEKDEEGTFKAVVMDRVMRHD